MTVIYLDVLFLSNLVVDYLLLLASARITGDRICRIRFVLGAFLGAVYASIIFFAGFEWLSHPFCKLCIGVLIALIGFGAGRKFLRTLLVFFVVSAALGGVILALQQLGTGGLTLENGVLYTGFDVRLLLVTIIVCYAVLSSVFGRAARHGAGKEGELCRAQIVIEGKCLELDVLLDTGNTLTDPVNNRPVMVVEECALRELLPEGIDSSDPAGSLERIDCSMRRRFRLLPYRAVGVEYGMLLAVRTDYIVLGGNKQSGLLAALSPTPVSDGGSYRALLGPIDHQKGRKQRDLENQIVRKAT